MNSAKNSVTRVVFIDGTPATHEPLSALLQTSIDIHLAGEGSSGEDTVRLVRKHHPDLLVLSGVLRPPAGISVTGPAMSGTGPLNASADSRAPAAGQPGGSAVGQSGSSTVSRRWEYTLDVVRQVMRESPLPVLLLADSAIEADDEHRKRALQAGAVALVVRPNLTDAAARAELLALVRTMAGVPVIHHWGRQKAARRPMTTAPLVLPSGDTPALAANLQIIGIASSTGGPNTLAGILGALPADFPWPILLVQHVKPGFGSSMADWLNTQTEMRVRLAEPGMRPEPGTALFAPDDFHLRINMKGEVELSKETAYKTLRPSANFMFSSLAAVYKSRAMGIILTGMGDDGVDGLEQLYSAGGYVIAQDAESCVVYGMPKAAAEQRVVSRVLSPGAIANLLINCALCKKKPEAC